jgi:hypothetical protein
MRIELLSVHGCPHLHSTREMLRECLAELGLNVAVEERIGDYASPSVVVNGADVMGRDDVTGAMCRLDVPNRDRVLAALRKGNNG